MSADIVSLAAFRTCRDLPPPRDEAWLPPPGKRRGDLVADAQGSRGTVLGYAARAIFGRGPGIVLAIQFPGVVRVLPAHDVIALSGPAVDEAGPPNTPTAGIEA
jgi:hypothetical protein